MNPTSFNIQETDVPWGLREVSRLYAGDLARVEISWPPQHTLMYLVTWRVEGGLLQGNLLTNTSSVTISLAPNTLFRIQVRFQIRST